MLGIVLLESQKILIFEVFLLNILRNEIKVYFFLDWVSLIFRRVVIFISGLVIFYRDRYIYKDKSKKLFLLIVLIFVLSILIIVIRPNIIIIILGWDGLGLVSYCLVIFYQNEVSRIAGIITILTNRLGDIGLLLRVIFLINVISWDINIFIKRDFFIILIGVFIILGAVTKRAQMPFSAWLPAAIAAPTPVSSLVHSSTLVTAGVYLIIRFNELFISNKIRIILFYISLITIFIAGIGAIFEIDLKKIIALSTLRQLGVIIIILSFGKWGLGFFHLISHAIFKAILFLCAGVLIHGIIGYQDIRILRIIYNCRPFIRRIIILSSLSLSGIFFLRGFYSKDMVLEYIYMINIGVLIIIFLFIRTIITIIYSLRLGYYCLWKRLVGQFEMNYLDDKKILFSISVIGLFVIIFGSIISWLIKLDLVFLILDLLVKINNLILVILSLILFYFNMNLYLREKIKKLFYFLGLIWFLVYVRRIFNKLLFSFEIYYKNFDQGWLEEVNSMGGENIIIKIRIIFSWLQIRNIKNLLIIGIIILGLLI